jgi:hypothetical protein
VHVAENAKTQTSLFGDETLQHLDRLLAERYGASLKIGETLGLSAWAEGDACYATLLLRNADESLYYPIEVRVAVDAKAGKGAGKDSAGEKDPVVASQDKAGKLLVDVLDHCLGEYLRGDRDVFLTLDWSELSFGDQQVQARGQVVNRKLERMADELLAKAGEGEEGEV